MGKEEENPGRREVSLDLTRPILAERLLANQSRVQIMFKGHIYTLSQTRNDKLILTK